MALGCQAGRHALNVMVHIELCLSSYRVPCTIIILINREPNPIPLASESEQPCENASWAETVECFVSALAGLLSEEPWLRGTEPDLSAGLAGNSRW